MEKLDLRRELKHLYQPSAKKPVIVDVPPMRFLAIDGTGSPEGDRFQASMRALFTLAYSVRFAARDELGLDYPVMPPEGIYRHTDGGPLKPPFSPGEMAWTLQIMVPDEVPEEFVEKIRGDAKTREKGGPLLDDVRVQATDGRRCVQMMHIGPYDTENTTITRLVEFANEQGYEIVGLHHEIYVGDPNRAAPEKLKTTLRLGIR